MFVVHFSQSFSMYFSPLKLNFFFKLNPGRLNSSSVEEACFFQHNTSHLCNLDSSSHSGNAQISRPLAALGCEGRSNTRRWPLYIHASLPYVLWGAVVCITLEFTISSSFYFNQLLLCLLGNNWNDCSCWRTFVRCLQHSHYCRAAYSVCPLLSLPSYCIRCARMITQWRETRSTRMKTKNTKAKKMKRRMIRTMKNMSRNLIKSVAIEVASS